MYINLIGYRNLKDIIDRCIPKDYVYGRELRWRPRLSYTITNNNPTKKLSNRLDRKPDRGLYMLHCNPGRLSDELSYGEIFNSYYMLSNVIEGEYEIADDDCDDDYDEYL